MARRGQKSCRKCRSIRLFLVTAGALLGMMLVAPDHFALMGQRLPSPMAIAAIIPLIGIPVFFVKYLIWRSDVKHAARHAEQSEG